MTDRQEEILTFIESYINKNGYSPTIREIGKAVNLASTSSVHAHVRKMIEAGYLTYGTTNGAGLPRTLKIAK